MTLALHTYEDKPEERQFDILSDGSRIEVTPSATQSQGSSVQVEESATNEEVTRLKEKLMEILSGVKRIQAEAKLSMIR